MRRYEIDWVRNISILMLFVYHTSAIFCMFGDFYIISDNKNMLANLLIVLMFVWYMPSLFFLAGASTYFASKKRNYKEYMIERLKKLLVPLVFGILILVPPQTYMARIWRGETNIKYIDHLKYFFTNITDFTGFDGGFTPAHLWFILYLFIVSFIGGYILFNCFKDSNKIFNLNKIKSLIFNKFSILILLLMGIVSDIFPSIMGKSIVGCLLIFILGYIVYSEECIIDKIVLKRFKFLLALISVAIIGVLYVFKIKDLLPMNYYWIIESVLKNMVLIFAIASIVGFSSVYLNKNNSVLKYLNEASFPVYIIHQPILLVIALFVIPTVKSTLLSMILIIFTSLIVTFLIYELLKKVKVFRIVFGMKI